MQVYGSMVWREARPGEVLRVRVSADETFSQQTKHFPPPYEVRSVIVTLAVVSLGGLPRWGNNRSTLARSVRSARVP